MRGYGYGNTLKECEYATLEVIEVVKLNMNGLIVLQLILKICYLPWFTN